jgi:hypothetical protein
MADTDASSPILRYNLITQGVEYFQGSDFYPVAPAAPFEGGVVTGATEFQQTVTFDKAPVMPVAVLAGTGTVTPVATAASTFTMIVSGAVTLNGPSSPVNGQKVTFRILNDGSHSVTLATGSGNFRFGTDITGYTNSVSLTDYIGAIYNLPALSWDVVSLIQGF